VHVGVVEKSKREDWEMSANIKKTLQIMDKLGESEQITILKFAEFLAAENEDDNALYDEAKAADDGYRIDSEDLRAKYGI